MYFNGNKNNTNIDNEFNGNNNVLSFTSNFFSKYKKIFFIGIILFILLIVMLLLFSNRKIEKKLELSGEEVIVIYQGSDYIEPGYHAYNTRDEDLTSKVIIESNLNNNVIGEYEIVYKIGNVTKVRYVSVIEKPKDYTFLHLTSVNNNRNVYLKKGESYKEPGYMAITTSGKDLTSKVTITGKVDTSKKGVYVLTYSIVDSNNVELRATRKVIVMDSEISLTLDNEDYTNKDVTISAYVIDEYFDYMILPDNKKVTTNIYSYKVSNNGTYTFKTYSKKDNVKESSIKVSNIDKVVPSGSCSGSYKDGVSMININASDNIGIDRYVISGKSYTSKNITINSELKIANVIIYDKAGNSKNISCNLTDKNVYEQENTTTTKPSGGSSNTDSSDNSSSSTKPSTGSSSNTTTTKPSTNNGSQESKPLTTNANISINTYNNKFRYWLYLPNTVTKNLPIVVYLPGLGEMGISNGPIKEIKDYGHSYNAIIIHMLVPSGGSVNSYLSDYVSLLNEIVSKYGANKNKISIMGFSHGCYGLVNMIEKYPNYFSAAVFVGCGPNKRIDIKKYINQPIWSFVGYGDGERDYNDQYGSHYSLENFVKSINTAGGDAKYTSVKEKSYVHNVMNSNYSILRDKDYNLINWMMSK